MKTLTNKRRFGFTLIELLVVIAIIALLLSIVVPSLKMAKEVARRTICATHLKALGQGLLVYADKNKDKLPLSRYQVGFLPSASYQMFEIELNRTLAPKDRVTTASNGQKRMYGWGFLYYNDVIDEPKTYYCPSTLAPPGNNPTISDDDVDYRYNCYSDNGSTYVWNNNTNDANRHFVRSGYNYVPQASGTRRQIVTTTAGYSTAQFPDIATKASQMSSLYAIGTDLLFSLDNLPHKKGSGRHAAGVNLLNGDGSVGFSNSSDAFNDALWTTQRGNIGSDEFKFRTVLSLLK